jgi:hypothetical protein
LGVDIDSRDEEGCTPLIIASKRGSRQVVKLLMKNRADKTAVDDQGLTAVQHATSPALKIDIYKGLLVFLLVRLSCAAFVTHERSFASSNTGVDYKYNSRVVARAALEKVLFFLLSKTVVTN